MPFADGADGADGALAAVSGAVRTVLVVDDEPLVRGVLVEILDVLGHEAIAVESGEEAVEFLSAREGPLTAAFVDVKMRGMSGLACVVELRRIRPGLPCIVISGLSAEEISGAVPSGVAWLAKPFTVADVRQALAALPLGAGRLG